ncbi:MFS transporter [Actinomadura alba]|uniref:MFS transporter n=1 Tax=Actinomadura alba TaxID=406431 RepID=A0ABR7LRL9_9ACTN|nr:MFS transporter [Actinomadura alba]MBC6467125.1 MFS transporter [Actinomadura alba]
MATGITDRNRQARVSAYAGFAVQGLCFSTLVTRVPRIQDAHGLSDGRLALVLLLVPVIAGLGSVLAGVLFRRRGSAAVLRISQPAVCVTIALVGLVDGVMALYGAVALFGLFIGAVDASMNAQAVAVERRYGLSLVTGFYAVWSVAGIAGGLWSALANRLEVSLFAGFAGPALVGVAVSLLTGPRLLGRSEEGRAPGSRRLKAAAEQVPWRPVLIVGTAMACMYVADAATSGYSTKYLEDELGGSSTVAPLAYVAYQVAMVAARAVADLGVRRLGAAQVVRLGGLTGLLGMVGVVAAPNAPVAIAAFAVVGLGLCVVPPVAFSAADRVDPTGLGVAVARVNVFNYVGFVLGAAVVGAIAPTSTDHGLRLAFAVPAVLTLVIVLAAGGFQPRPVPAASPGDHAVAP